ncbi:unnamed protein product [Echinostoma caproni]|uniref:Ig-like domain-containing protein n=1 Tax=Echinostoma caproni TaxID=27848 RepID=A0A183AJJ3_9TREM|nr:unnamed protein product [Echinostoma caproni]
MPVFLESWLKRFEDFFKFELKNKNDIFDPVSIVMHQLVFREPIIQRVSLRPTFWPSTERDAASFRCTVYGSGINLVAELLFCSNQSVGLNTQRRYLILSRKKLPISVLGRIGSVNLTWLEVPSRIFHGEFICLVRPDSESVQRERYLNVLPLQTRNVQFSASIRHLTIVPHCPVQPLLRVSTSSKQLSLGSRFEASCIAATTTDGLPLKLYYLTPKLSIIICTKMELRVNDTRLPVSVPAPCFSVAPEDHDCTRKAPRSSIDRTYYPTLCNAAQSSTHTALFRTIHFAVTKLRPEDLHGRLFCKTIDIYSMWSAVKQSRTPQLNSKVHLMRFRVQPQIWSFNFLPELQGWECRVIAYPMYGRPVIQLIQATPVWLQIQLDSYSSFENQTMPEILNSHLLPTSDRNEQEVEFDSGEYYCSTWSPGYFHTVNETMSKLLKGDKKQIAFGYRLLTVSPIFRFAEIGSIPVGHMLHLRCVAWATNHHQGKLNTFTLLPMHRPMGSNRTVHINQVPGALVKAQSEHYQRIDDKHELYHIGCLMIDRMTEQQLVLPGPKTECRVPEDLHWYPAQEVIHLKTGKISCTTQVGCPHIQFQWHWVAGPVPQLTPPSDRIYQEIKPGPELDLSQLPRCGTYVFRCTVTCWCGQEFKTNSIQASFYFETDHLEHNKQDMEQEARDGNTTLGSSSNDSDISLIQRRKQERSIIKGEVEGSPDEVFALRRLFDTSSDRISKDIEFERIQPCEEIKQQRELEGFTDGPDQRDRHSSGSFLGPLLTWLHINVPSGRYVETVDDITSQTTDYLDYALRPTENFRSHIVRGCNRFMSTMAVRCPGSFDSYSPNLELNEWQREALTKGLFLGLNHLRSHKEFRKMLNRNLEDYSKEYDSLKKMREASFRNFCRKRTSSEEYEIYENENGTMDRYLKVPITKPRDEAQQSKSSVSVTSVADKSATSKRRRLIRVAHNRTEKSPPLIKDYFSHLNSEMRYIPLGYRASLFGRGGLEDTRWSHLRAFRERTRRKFMFIEAEQRSAPKPEYLESLALTKENLEELDETILSNTNRTLLHILPWDPNSLEEHSDDWNQRQLDYPDHDSPSDRSLITDPMQMTDELRWSFYNNRINHARRDARTNFVPVKFSDRSDGFPGLKNLAMGWPSLNLTRMDTGWSTFFNQIALYFRETLSNNGNEECDEAILRDELEIIPGLITLPSTTTIICPVPTISEGSDHKLTKLVWQRIAQLDRFDIHAKEEVEEIIQLAIERRELKLLSPRFISPNRVYTYPPKRWPNAFTLDIVNLNVEDFGYYACVSIFESKQVGSQPNNRRQTLEDVCCLLVVNDLLTFPHLGQVTRKWSACTSFFCAHRSGPSKRMATALALANIQIRVTLDR